MKKSVLLVAAASALVLVAACGESVGSSQAICVDRKSNQRIDDSWCNSAGDHDPGMGWFFLSSGQTAPAVGGRTTSGSWSVPSNTKPTYGGINKSGGSVSLNKPAAPAPKANGGTKSGSSSRGSSGSSSRGGSSSGASRGGR